MVGAKHDRMVQIGLRLQLEHEILRYCYILILLYCYTIILVYYQSYSHINIIYIYMYYITMRTCRDPCVKKEAASQAAGPVLKWWLPKIRGPFFTGS